ncbi:CHAT domain-containing protein [Candidatus Obscuribacterales bacterium]|nr:CHAT domain-containing protein [Candidatus Obscuribacterales bacterium]
MPTDNPPFIVTFMIFRPQKFPIQILICVLTIIFGGALTQPAAAYRETVAPLRDLDKDYDASFWVTYGRVFGRQKVDVLTDCLKAVSELEDDLDTIFDQYLLDDREQIVSAAGKLLPAEKSLVARLDVLCCELRRAEPVLSSSLKTPDSQISNLSVKIKSLHKLAESRRNWLALLPAKASVILELKDSELESARQLRDTLIDLSYVEERLAASKKPFEIKTNRQILELLVIQANSLKPYIRGLSEFQIPSSILDAMLKRCDRVATECSESQKVEISDSESRQVPNMLGSTVVLKQTACRNDLDKVRSHLQTYEGQMRELGADDPRLVGVAESILRDYREQDDVPSIVKLSQNLYENCSRLPELEFAEIIHKLSKYLEDASPKHALDFSTTGLKRLEAAKLVESSSYAKLLCDFSSACSKRGRYFEALESAENARTIFERKKLDAELMYANFCLAKVMRSFGLNKQALALLSKNLRRLKSQNDDDLSSQIFFELSELYSMNSDGRLGSLLKAKEYTYRAAAKQNFQLSATDYERYHLQLAVIAASLRDTFEFERNRSVISKRIQNTASRKRSEEILDAYYRDCSVMDVTENNVFELFRASTVEPSDAELNPRIERGFPPVLSARNQLLADLQLTDVYFLKRLEQCIVRKIQFQKSQIEQSASTREVIKGNALLVSAVKSMSQDSTSTCSQILEDAKTLFEKELGADSYECIQCEALSLLRRRSETAEKQAQESPSLPAWTLAIPEFGTVDYRGTNSDTTKIEALVSRCGSKSAAIEEIAYLTCLIREGPSVNSVHFYRACPSSTKEDLSWGLEIVRRLLSEGELILALDTLERVSLTGASERQCQVDVLLRAALNLELGNATTAFEDLTKMMQSIPATDSKLAHATQEIYLKSALGCARWKDASLIAHQVCSEYQNRPPEFPHEFEKALLAANALALDKNLPDAIRFVRNLVLTEESKPQLLSRGQRADLIQAYARLKLQAGALSESKRLIEIAIKIRNDPYAPSEDYLVKYEIMRRSNEASEATLRKAESEFSKASTQLAVSQLISYTHRLDRYTDLVLTFNDYPKEILRWKGRLLDVIRLKSALGILLQSDHLKSTDPAQLQKEIESYRAVRKKLAQALLSDRVNPIELESLSREKERHEHNLQLFSERESDLKENSVLNVEELVERIPHGEVFVNIHKYFNVLKNEFRYVACVLDSRCIPTTPKWKVTSAESLVRKLDLGRCDVVDQKILFWLNSASLGNYQRDRDIVSLAPARKSERAVKAEETNVALASLQQQLFAPIESELPAGTERIWFCPDSTTFLVPWDLLARSSRLSLSCATVDSVNDFIRVQECSNKMQQPKPLLALSYSFRNWERPLKNTVSEAAKIAQKAELATGNISVSVDKIVDSDELLGLAKDAGYLHLATHGFFLKPVEKITIPDSQSKITESVATKLRASRLALGTSFNQSSFSANPLLSSGVLLYTEDKSTPKVTVLTAEEILGSDLSNCEIVSLSACETGLGRIVDGQGILGLRSAFRGAGAHSVLMSLWPVDDAATELLMTVFYETLWSGKTKLEALRTAQEAVKNNKRHDWSHQNYWAGWILSGESW